MAVPFIPRGYIDLQEAVTRLAKTRYPSTFDTKTIIKEDAEWKILSLIRGRSFSTTPDQSLTPHERVKYDVLDRVLRNRQEKRDLVASELRQALGDGDLPATYLLPSGLLASSSPEVWRTVVGLKWVQQPVMPGQVDSRGNVVWGVLIAEELFERWLAGPPNLREQRQHRTPEALDAWLIAHCQAEMERGRIPKYGDAIEALQREMKCGRDAARASYARLPRELRRQRGNRAAKCAE